MDGLYELVSEYVCRKYTVLVDLAGQAPRMRKDIMSPNVWTKMRDIKTMSKWLKIPSWGGGKCTCCSAPSHTDGPRGPRWTQPFCFVWL